LIFLPKPSSPTLHPEPPTLMQADALDVRLHQEEAYVLLQVRRP
jgi:hypothetical protein